MHNAQLSTIPEGVWASILGDGGGIGPSEASDEAGEARILAGLRGLRKADVHCHALLNAPLATYERIVGHALPPPPLRFQDFGQFSAYLATNLLPAIHSLDAIQTLLRAGLERMVEEGVAYAEASIDLLLPARIGATPQALMAVVAEERDRISDRLHFAPEIGINRRVPVDRTWPQFVTYVESGLFRSIDLYDDERAGDLHDFQRFYRLARARGLWCKAHAGETCGPERVRETLELLDVDAIQHGTAAASDPHLVEDLARRGTQLNLCMASNVALGVAGSYEAHPIFDLLAAGIPVALGTDDFTLFGAGLSEEICRLYRAGMPIRDLARLRLGPP